MAPNKFATMLNRKTNRITLVLVYAVLEWTLIVFLLLNSLFSYLIIKFAKYFGLTPPCLLCSRLDHIFEPPNSKTSYRDLICEQHAIDLSRSGYCFNHRKLVESQDMCEDCWSSHQGDHQHPTAVLAFRWLKEIGIIKPDGDCEVVENCDVNLKCSCCGVTIKSENLAPHAVIKPSSGVLEDTRKAIRDEFLDDVDFDGVLEDTQKKNMDELVHEVNIDEEMDQTGTDSVGIEGEDQDGVERSRDIQMGPYSDLIKEDDNSEGFSFSLSKEGYSLVEADEDDEDEVLEAETEPLLKGSSSASIRFSYADEKILPQHLEFYIDLDDYQLIPVEFADIEMENSKGKNRDDGEEDQKNKDQEKFNELWRETDEGLVLEPEIMVTSAAFDAVKKFNSSSLDLVELYETKIEDLPTKQGQEQEIMREIDIGLKSDEAMVKDLPSKKSQEEEEIKREVGAAVVLNEYMVELLSIIEGQVEVTTKEIDFHVAGDKEHDVLFTSSGDQVLTGEREVTELDDNIPTSVIEGQVEVTTKDIDFHVAGDEEHDVLFTSSGDQVLTGEREVTKPDDNIPTSVIEGQVEVTTKEIDFHVAGDEEHDVLFTSSGDQVLTGEREVTELDDNIPTSDFGDLSHKENDEIDIVCSVESIYNSEVAEPVRPCEDEFPLPNDVICEAYVSLSGLLEKGDYEPEQPEEAQNKVDYEPIQTEETQNHKDMTVEITELELQGDVALSHDPIEVEEDRIPGTPNSVHSLNHLHREMPLLWRMGSAEAETLHDSTANELKSGEEVVTVEELKSLLESERKTLRVLYAELDEERNAAAIATNHTMAMINRLQEEKATIEMEALQYQRIMEEQSEYDQEALQLLNEMLVKREKELQELEKELEVCRKKVMDYEERERIRLLSQRKDKRSTVSCSNGEESDGLSVDLNHELHEENGSWKCEGNGLHHNTPVDEILDLQDPLYSFELERMSILDKLKALEEKLCSLAEEEEFHIENMKPFEQFYEENAKEFDRSFELNGDDTNGKHHQEKRINGSKPKQLLPLFDEAEIDSDGELSNEIEDGLDSLAINKPLPTKFELEKKRVAIEEEVDHVYERLHALEADREFVKHCVGSLRKGDKGVHLLQEILEHLRDLKYIEFQARNVCGAF